MPASSTPLDPAPVACWCIAATAWKHWKFRFSDGEQLTANVYIVTDGVFSMDGSIAPLNDLCDLAERHGAAVIVDEAHGTGVLGDHGRGACDFCNVEHRVLLRVGTMSKAMGGLGGFAVSSRNAIELLRNTARTQFFSTALPQQSAQR